ncbi:translocation/assembly module TamB domain-containing protein [Fodinibius salsisoli]|uniref:Translocation/assembly module TamB domain-containing protein n=1 Tax=Fodinibius salsisoli TaxID=2820877 RepID=A0ABT3PMF3_9BACT|nr:translocation/assembly module TamB domain-containing protein [Fodinibius salsisoli]MCW9707099.1 translocation/assembly module TamB domain-containing protein [Fodinibius salsisoli]
MNKKSKHNSQRNTRRKWPWILLCSLLVVVALARLALMTDPVHQWIKQAIVSAAGEQLAPELSIGNISGDLWKGATLSDVQLRADRPIASIDTVQVEYNVWSYFGEALEIKKVRVVNPLLTLRQETDSSWNVQHWMKDTGTAQDTTGGTFPFVLSDLLIEKGKFEVGMLQLPQDSSILIDELNLSSRIANYGKSYEASLRSLTFNVQNTNIDAPITIETAAEADSSSITLEKLAVATGHSLLNASGQAHLADSTAHFQAEASPVGWQDLAAYAQTLPIREDINMSIDLKGTVPDFELALRAHAEGIENVFLQSHFEYDSTLTLTTFQLSAGQLDLQSFTGDTSMPSIRNLQFQSQGRIPLEAYQESQLEGTLLVEDIGLAEYHLDRLQGSFNLQNNRATVELMPANGKEQLTFSADIFRLWDEDPLLQMKAGGTNLHPQNWLPGETYTGRLSFEAAIDGNGWVPEEELWKYQLNIEESQLMDQQIERASFSGFFNQNRLTNQSKLTVGRSRIGLQAEVGRLQNTPEFNYSLTADSVNLADFTGLERYTSSITAEVEGRGSGTSLEDLDMKAGLKMGPSIFRGERIQKMALDVHIADSVVSVSQGVVESDILAGTFTSRIHMENLYAPANVVDLDMQLKDISSLAAIAEVDKLQAAGSIQGQLIPTGQDSVAFESTVDITDFNYDNQFSAPKIAGDLRIDLGEEPQYSLDVEVQDPTVASMELQNIRLKTDGQFAEHIRGSFDLQLAGRGKDQISQAGNYSLGEDTTAISLSKFDLTTDLRTLSLQRPFHAMVEKGVIQTDTLHLSTPDNSAFMELAVPYADSFHQKGYFKAKELNLKAIQDGILHESYFTGILSGEFQVDRTDTSMTASSDVVMSDLMYEETKLDTLRLQGDIENENLVGMMALHQHGDLIAEGNLDIPFKVKDPDQLRDNFFERPVSGALQLHAVKLSRFSTLLEQWGYENTKGTLQFDGQLKGKAGQPELNAALKLREAELSGVPIDSLIASVEYDHQESSLGLNATLTSLKQKALEANALMPLEVDLRKWAVGLPDPQDSISVNIQTNQFNLRALNDFLDRSVTRDLKGEVNGQVQISGPRENLQAEGNITLAGGAVRVVDAGIRLENMQSAIQFKPDRVELTNLQINSGRGRLNAQGVLALEQLVPGDIDLKIQAENFKAANTEEYNGIVNLDLEVDGEVSKPHLSGSVDIVNGFVKLDNFGEKSVEEVSLDTTLNAEPNISLYDSLSMDMDINFNRRFWVRNQRYLEMELELDGQIDVLKDTGKDLQIFGTLTTANGYAEPLGKRFELEEGVLAFSGPPDNPQVNVRTLYEPPQAEQEIKIWYVIEGTVEEPKFKYESSPQMDLAGIISYTLFGQPFYKLNPAEQSVASTSSNNTAADFAVEVLLDRVEALATRRLGIDVVRIEQTRIGGESGTSITTGWYINPKVFFAIQNVITGSTPTTGFFLEYYLKQNLKLILSQGNDNRQGVDVQWEHDY